MSENIQKNEKLKKNIDSELNESQMDNVSGGGLFTGVDMGFDISSKIGDVNAEGAKVGFFNMDKTSAEINMKTSGKRNQAMISGSINMGRC